jgi:hypothetical protein
MTDEVIAADAEGGSTPRAYVSGERVFGPPVGTFDIDWVAREVERSTVASFPDAHRAVAAAWNRAREHGVLDGQALADAARGTGVPPDVGDSVADYVIAYCQAYAVDPAAR